MEVLEEQFQKKKLPAEITYGSDCSGVDAPMWALTTLLSELKDLLTLTE